MSNRFQVVDGSQSGHCCFEHTVIDTSRPVVYHGVPFVDDGQQRYTSVCECFGRTEADMIAASLNAASIAPPDFDRPWRLNEQGVWEVEQLERP